MFPGTTCFWVINVINLIAKRLHILSTQFTQYSKATLTVPWCHCLWNESLGWSWAK